MNDKDADILLRDRTRKYFAKPWSSPSSEVPYRILKLNNTTLRYSRESMEINVTRVPWDD